MSIPIKNIRAERITGSLDAIGINISGSLSGSFSGSLQGTASFATNALTASWANNATSASFATTASYYNIGFTPENVSNKENTTLDTSPTKYPTNRLVKEVTDLKLDKVSTAGVERVYTINADGSQGTKHTSSLKEVIEGYFNGTNFYTDALFTNLITPESGKIYLNLAVTPATQYRWSGSAYVQIGGVKAKFTIYKNFAINPMSDFTNWYRQVSDLAGFTANAGITNTNAFSGDTNRFPQSPIPFTFKIKNINVNLESNTAGLLTFDFAIRSFELPLGIVNSGLTTNSTNNKIIGRKSVQQTHGGGQPNYSFTGTEIDTTTILSANSYLKLYIKNNSGVSAGSVQGMVAITIEEV